MTSRAAASHFGASPARRWAFVVVAAAVAAAIAGQSSRTVGFVAFFAAVVAARFLTTRRGAQSRTAFGGEGAVLVGDADAVASAVTTFARYPEYNVRPLATVTTDGSMPTALGGGGLDQLAELLADPIVRHAVVVSNVSAQATATLLKARDGGIRLSVLPPMADALTAAVDVVDVRGLPFISLAPRRPAHGPAWIAKRIIDFVAAAIGLLVLAPLLLLVAVAIKFESPGPVLFRQRRVGRDGNMFDLWKFRSMVSDAEDRLADLEHLNEASGPYFKIENDPRVTRLGRWLRRLSIDELPQLVNVVRGEMSLVGPRPFLASELAADPEAFEWRLSFTPGITGLWQIAGRSWLPRLEGIRMDRAYIEHWSLLLDLRILFRTLFVALRNDRRPSITSQGSPAAFDRAPYLARVSGDDLVPTGRPTDVSVVVVSHESRRDIDACLASLRLLRDSASIEVIVVDNKSSDGTADYVAEQFPDARLIRKRFRDGFSVNSNIGAVASSGRYVLFLNPDTEVFDGSIDRLVNLLDQDRRFGAAGPRLVYPDGAPQASARRFPRPLATVVRRTPLRGFVKDSFANRNHLVRDFSPGGVTDVDWLLGAALMVRRETLGEIGGFDDKFRLYCEDIDLCWRIHDSGHGVAYLDSAVMQHALGELTGKKFFTVRTVWHYRSMARFLRLHGFRRPVSVPRVIELARRPAPAPVAPKVLAEWSHEGV